MKLNLSKAFDALVFDDVSILSGDENILAVPKIFFAIWLFSDFGVSFGVVKMLCFRIGLLGVCICGITNGIGSELSTSSF